MINLNGKEYQCKMEVSIDLIGGKWKSLILWYLSKETLRFNELKRLLPKVTQKMLTQQLRYLENDGLITRKVYAQIPPKVEYSISETGKKVIPILQLMCDFGADYINNFSNSNSQCKGED